MKYFATFAVGLSYFAAARIGLVLASINHNASPFWPATGVAILCLYFLGIKKWPAVAFAAFVANYLAHTPITVSVAIAMGNAAEAVVGAELFRRLIKHRSRIQFQFEAVAAALMAVFPTSISATVGNLALATSGQIAWSGFADSWLTWWVGDALGALYLIPLALVLPHTLNGLLELKRKLFGLKFIAFLIGFGWLASWVFWSGGSGPWMFTLLALILVAAGHFGAVVASCSVVLVFSIGIVATVLGQGPFSGGTLNENLIHLQLFLVAITTAGAMLPGLLGSPGQRKLPTVCLLASWALAAGLFQSFQYDEGEKDKRKFDAMVDTNERAIKNRFADYEDALRSGVSFYAASDFVSRAEWRTFFAEFELKDRFPGILGIGVTFPVATENLEIFEQAQKKEVPDFNVHKPTSAEETVVNAPNTPHYVVTYMEPEGGNESILGLDLAAESNRRIAAEHARDTGQPHATRRISLGSKKDQRGGFLLFFPYYKQRLGDNPSVGDRRRSFLCWIYAPFVIEKFFASIFGSQALEFGLEIFEKSYDENRKPIFTTFKENSIRKSKLERVTRISLAQQDLELVWYRAPRFISAHDSIGAWVALCAVVLGLLLTTIVVALRDVGHKASALAEEKTFEVRRLEKSNRTYTRLVQEIKDYGIIMIDAEGCISTWNDGARIITGHEQKEIIGKSVGILYPENIDGQQETAESNLTKAISDGRLETEAWRVRKDGAKFLTHVIYTRFEDEYGNLRGFSKVFGDVTAVRERERLQNEALTRLKLAVGASRMGFFYVDVKAGTVDYSDEVRSITGLNLSGNRDDDRNQFFSCIDPDYIGKLQGISAHFYGGANGDVDFEYPMKSPTLGRLWVRIFMHATRSDAKGAPLFIVAFIQDITTQKKASEMLSQSERRLAYALEGSGDGLWDWDLRTGEVYLSQKISGHFNGPSVVQRSVVGDASDDMHPDDRAKVSASMAAHLEGKTPLHECEVRFKRGGEWCWFLTRGKVTERDENGKPARVTGVHIDISALKAAEESARLAQLALEESKIEIQRQNSELLAATKAKTQFLATMSHEIRTPLNGVLGMADLLVETKLDSDQIDLVKIIQNSGTTLLAVINDILDFSKIDAGKLQLESIDFAVDAVVEAQVELLLAQARSKDLSVHCYIDPKMSLGRQGDPGRISQILLNLIGNAIKFTSKGSVSVLVQEVIAEAATPMVRFEIRDTGIGLTSLQTEVLFQPFSQADSSTSRKFGGTGLGLSICKGLAEAMMGRIGVESKVGIGSTFWFELPLPLSEEGHQRSFEGKMGSKSGSAVIVTPDPIVADLACRYIESWGMKARSYKALADVAVDLLATGAPDRPIVAILDAASNEHSPRLIKEHWGFPEISIVFLQGRRTKGHEPLPEGVSAILHLPLAQSALFNAVIKAISPEAQVSAPVPLPEQVKVESSVNILVAEDNAINQILVKRMLQSLGYSCDIVANGVKVLEALDYVKYDLILMDCQMPELDGYEATRRIRARGDESSQIPIIAVTANALAGDDRACIEAGMNDYITKPLKKSQLEAMMTRWLRQKQLGNEVGQLKAS